MPQAAAAPPPPTATQQAKEENEEEDGPLLYDKEEEIRVTEPRCLDILRTFHLREYITSSFSYYKQKPAALRNEILSGITLALIEVPESIAFAFMAGLSPYYGMASVFWVGTLTGLFGGRPAMISGAAGAMAVVMGNMTSDTGPLRDFTREERVEHLLMSILLIGVIETVCAPFLCSFVKIIPQSAMIGFMNALAIILVKGQADSFKVCTEADTLFNDCPHQAKAWLKANDGRLWTTLALVAITLLVMWGLPKLKRIGKVIPASLAAILIGTTLEWALFRPVFHTDSRTIADTAALASGLPGFHWPNLPEKYNLGYIISMAVSLALVGGVETVMTHEVVNSLLKEPPSTFASIQECIVQGIANFISGIFRGMGGSALIGETVINVLHGARGRVSCVCAGVTMLFIMEWLGGVVKLMPIATLTGVIFSVSLHTFQWGTCRNLHRLPRPDAGLIVLVTALSVVTNLAVGIAVGVGVASVWHVWETGMGLRASWSVGRGEDPQGGKGKKGGEEEVGVGVVVVDVDAHFNLEKSLAAQPSKSNNVSTHTDTPQKIYRISSPLFFGSTRPLLRIFNFDEDPPNVIVDLGKTELWDLSAITALNEAGKSYEEVEKTLTVIGLSEKGLRMIERYPVVASHLRIPALKQRVGERVESCMAHVGEDVLKLGPGEIELGLEMGVDMEQAHAHAHMHTHTEQRKGEVVAEEKGL